MRKQLETVNCRSQQEHYDTYWINCRRKNTC